MKDVLNLIAGEVLEQHGFTTEFFEQQLMLAIAVIGANPFTQLISNIF